MADGVSAQLANAMLSTMIANANDLQLHTGAPGANGTANVSSVTARQSLAWGSPSAGAVAITNQPAWTSWAGTNGEVDTDLSAWSASSGGTFEFSLQMSASATMDTGDSLTITALTASIPTAS